MRRLDSHLRYGVAIAAALLCLFALGALFANLQLGTATSAPPLSPPAGPPLSPPVGPPTTTPAGPPVSPPVGPRRSTAGALDPTFGSGGKVLTELAGGFYAEARAVGIQPDGKIVAAGPGVAGARGGDFALIRYEADGSLDHSFGSTGEVLTDIGSSSYDSATAVAIQQDGKIVVAGYSFAAGGGDFALVRYNPDGSLDAGFGSGGRVLTDIGNSTNDYAGAVAIQRDGKIVVAGVSYTGAGSDFALVRYEADGRLDPSFGSAGKVLTRIGNSSYDSANAVAVQRDGKIVAAGVADPGTGSGFALVRYEADGNLDPSFGTGGIVTTPLGSPSYDYASALAIYSDGKIVAAGYSYAAGTADFALVRYNVDGSLDTSFGSGGKVLTDFGNSTYDYARAIALERNGNIVVTGSTYAGPGADFAVVRYERGGNLDSSFGSGGKVLTDFGGWSDSANAVAIQRDGKIVAAGSSDAGGFFHFALARYIAR